MLSFILLICMFLGALLFLYGYYREDRFADEEQKEIEADGREYGIDRTVDRTDRWLASDWPQNRGWSGGPDRLRKLLDDHEGEPHHFDWKLDWDPGDADGGDDGDLEDDTEGLDLLDLPDYPEIEVDLTRASDTYDYEDELDVELDLQKRKKQQSYNRYHARNIASQRNRGRKPIKPRQLASKVAW